MLQETRYSCYVLQLKNELLDGCVYFSLPYSSMLLYLLHVIISQSQSHFAVEHMTTPDKVKLQGNSVRLFPSGCYLLCVFGIFLCTTIAIYSFELPSRSLRRLLNRVFASLHNRQNIIEKHILIAGWLFLSLIGVLHANTLLDRFV